MPDRLPVLPRSTSEGSVLQVARRLLGQTLVREYQGQTLAGRIVEVEAYAGRLDPAAHSHRGPTPRCATMFGDVHRAYVYFTYGNHHCVNVVAGSRADACAVLIRALEPTRGLATMRRLRAASSRAANRDHWLEGRRDHQLTSGPGMLAAALAIDLTLDGAPLDRRGALWLARGRRVTDVIWTPRVGLGRNLAAGWCWRCADARSAFVSKVPAAWPRHSRPTPDLTQARAEGHEDPRFRQRLEAGEAPPGSFSA